MFPKQVIYSLAWVAVIGLAGGCGVGGGARQQAAAPTGATGPAAASGSAAEPAGGLGMPKDKDKSFRRTTAEIEAEMQASNREVAGAATAVKKGKGLRLLMTGHSWVAPAVQTLPQIAEAGGYRDHTQRSHTSSGGSGSPNSIWLNEHGEYKGKENKTILLPAIATGEWDVMTWGMFFGDKPEHYAQWIDLCLKFNPKMVFYIQDGWPFPRGEKKDLPPEEMHAKLEKMYGAMMIPMVKGNYDALAARYPGKVHVISVGAAVVEMLDHYYAGELPGFDCLSESFGGKVGVYRDAFHLSSSGGMTWIVGYCYFAELYRRSPETIKNFHPHGVDPKVDGYLRTAAWHAITHSPFSGLTDENGNGIADQDE